MKFNKKTAAILIIFLIQIAATFTGVINKQMVLNTGKEFKLRVIGLDPYDPFRGRYLNINFEQRGTYKKDKPEWYPESGRMYMVLSVDDKGFGKVSYTTPDKPKDKYYIVSGDFYYEDQSIMMVKFPFNRYYVNEAKATKMEDALRKNTDNAYATVRVKGDKAVLEGLYVKGIPIEKYVAKE